MNLSYGVPNPSAFPIIVTQTSDDHLNRLTCSTVPLLCYWRNWEETARRTIEAIGAPFSPSANLCFEYPVASANMKSKSSFTDVMYISETAGVAVEGKWTEGAGTPQVAKWLTSGNRENRKLVLEHWLDLISGRSLGLDRSAVSNLSYQVIHRTASACSLPSERVFVVYQCFSTGVEKEVEPHLRRAAAVIRPTSNLEFWVQKIPMELPDFYRQMKERVGIASAEEKPALVRAAIVEGELFRFAAAITQRVV